MTFRRRLIDYALAAVLLAVPALMLHANLRDPGRRNGLDDAVVRVSAPLQAAVSWMVEKLGGVWTGYIALIDVEDENDELREEVARLSKELAAAERRAGDAETLAEMVKLRDKTPDDTVAARVISASINPFFRVSRISIDRGNPDVEADMAVITAQGLVGRVLAVYGDYADIMLITDATSAVDVYVQRTGGRGVLRGLGRDDGYACQVDWIDPGPGKAVKENDLIVTSGLGSFPAGVPVGLVSKVTTKEYTMFQEVEVTPIVDFSSLRTVMVLTAPPPPVDPDAGQRDRSGAAFGRRPY
jgi:rod shape-determining protein MreC